MNNLTAFEKFTLKAILTKELKEAEAEREQAAQTLAFLDAEDTAAIQGLTKKAAAIQKDVDTISKILEKIGG